MTDRSETPPDAIGARLQAWAADATVAAIFLTRLPIRWRGAWPADALRRSQWAFPVIGVLVGLAGAAAYAATAALGLPPMAAAVAAVAAQVCLTGALHEDGLADLADGMGGATPEARLAIMRDSRVGSYGVLALVLVVAARVAALTAIGAPAAVAVALAVSGAVSRAALPALLAWLPPARPDGLAAGAGRPVPAAIAVSIVLAMVPAVAMTGPARAAAAALAAAAAALAVGLLARRRLGGHTGDVLGAAQQAAEIAALLALAARP